MMVVLKPFLMLQIEEGMKKLANTHLNHQHQQQKIDGRVLTHGVRRNFHLSSITNVRKRLTMFAKTVVSNLLKLGNCADINVRMI